MKRLLQPNKSFSRYIRLLNANPRSEGNTNDQPSTNHSLGNFTRSVEVDDTNFKCLRFLRSNSNTIHSIYHCKVSTNTGVYHYIGIPSSPLIKRISNHVHTFKHASVCNCTGFSKFIWGLNNRHKHFTLEWNIFPVSFPNDKGKSYWPHSSYELFSILLSSFSLVNTVFLL